MALHRHFWDALGRDTAPDADVNRDALFEALASPRRRYALRITGILDDQFGGATALRTLADAVAARECRVAIEDLGDQQRKRVFVSLYQTHLPKLDDLGLVDWRECGGRTDQADQVVCATPETQKVSEILSHADEMAGGGD